MISKEQLKHVMLSNQRDIENYRVTPRQLPTDDFPCRVFIGVRRAGKTFILYQKMQQMLAEGHGWDEMVYVNFEDDRISGFSLEDFDLILACHAELCDTTLGGRYLPVEVYPYSFAEYLTVKDVACDDKSLLINELRGKVVREWNEYLQWGGLPESVGLSVKRDYLSSTFQKIYLGDIVGRNKISNPNLLRLLLKKIAENVRQPVSYNRLSQVLSSVSGKITTPTVTRFIECCEEAWLLFRLRNVSAPFADKETSCKYYFVDNGILNLFLIGGETALLENLAAMMLFRSYGHDQACERVFFYNDRVEVDFYIPEDELAIQVCYSLTQSPDTYEREVGALTRLPKVLPCRCRVILTYDEGQTITDQYGTIEVMPLWMFNC